MSPIVFRILAILLGLSPFLVAELFLILVQPGNSHRASESRVRLFNVRPLFRLNENKQRYEISSDREPYFRPDGFAHPKPSDEFRVFCLGGSTVQGRPYSIETSFTTWLELSLNELEPRSAREHVVYEVVNCGGVSYASYRLVPILSEVLRYEPDVVIVYTGHNEFLEDYGQRQQSSLSFPRVNDWLSRSRIYSTVTQIVRRQRKRDFTPRPILPEEVDALLDYEGGLNHYRRDDAWRTTVIDEYSSNLHRLVHLANAAAVPLLLVNPVSNLSDCPPFKVQHRDGLIAAERQQWDRLFQRGQKLIATDLRQAIDALEQASRLDDQHAGLHFQLAACHEAMGAYEQAKFEYRLAKESDICPLRMLDAMHDALLRIASTTRTPIVDARKLFAENSLHGMCGNSLLLDHVHPTVEGHQLLAAKLVEKLAHLGLIPQPDANWQARLKTRFAAHIQSLDAQYFDHGQLRLENLRAWTQGRAKKVRQSDKNTADDSKRTRL